MQMPIRHPFSTITNYTSLNCQGRNVSHQRLHNLKVLNKSFSSINTVFDPLCGGTFLVLPPGFFWVKIAIAPFRKAAQTRPADPITTFVAVSHDFSIFGDFPMGPVDRHVSLDF